MKNLLYALLILITITFISSCLYDKAEDAIPENGCDTTYYTLVIKPIIDHNCAISGCHVIGGIGFGDFTTYSGLKPHIDNGQMYLRINVANPGDQLHMPRGAVLDASSLSILNTWIVSGYPGCD